MRDYKELNDVDLKLALLSGSDIKVENLVIKPYILQEIKDYGYSNYMSNLQWISISIDDFIASVEDENKREILKSEKSKLKTFDFYCKLGGQEILNQLINSIKMIFRTKDIVFLNNNVIAVDFMKNKIIDIDGNINHHVLDSFSEDELTVIHRDNFDDIVEVVKLQNYLKKPTKKEEFNPVDEETRKLMEIMENNRKKVEAKKKAKRLAEHGEEEQIDISDIISAVSQKSNTVDIFNIWNLTLYQLYDAYTRLELIDGYEFSIKAMMAGAENVDLRHWSSRI